MSEQPGNRPVTEILMREFPKDAIKHRPGARNRQLAYFSGDTIIRRLIEATDNRFDVTVISFEMKGKLAQALVELNIPGLGRRQGVGVQMVPDGAGEDLVKGVVTDGLKKAATLFGVGLELYGEDYEAQPRQVPGQSSTSKQNADPKANELGRARREQVKAMIEDYEGWTLQRASQFLRSIYSGAGTFRWSALADDMLELFQEELDGLNDEPAATETPATNAPVADQSDEQIISRINAVTQMADLVSIGNEILKRFRDSQHPVRLALHQRRKELEAA